MKEKLGTPFLEDVVGWANLYTKYTKFSASRDPHPCRAPVHEAGGPAGHWRLENTCNIESNSNLIPGQAPSNAVFIFWIYLSLQRKRFLWARSGHNPGRLQRLHQLITSKICAIIIIWIDASSILLEVTSRSQLDPSCLEMWLSSADLTTIYSLQLRGE